jgi:hypothetical protein
MANSIPTWVRLTESERKQVECIKEQLGFKSLSETIRYLITRGIEEVNRSYGNKCQR